MVRPSTSRSPHSLPSFPRSPIRRRRPKKKRTDVPSVEEIDVLLQVMLSFSSFGHWISGSAKTVYNPVYKKFCEYRNTAMSLSKITNVLRNYKDIIIYGWQDPLYIANDQFALPMWKAFRFLATHELRKHLKPSPEANLLVKNDECWKELDEFNWETVYEKVAEMEEEERQHLANQFQWDIFDHEEMEEPTDNVENQLGNDASEYNDWMRCFAHDIYVDENEQEAENRTGNDIVAMNETNINGEDLQETKEQKKSDEVISVGQILTCVKNTATGFAKYVNENKANIIIETALHLSK